MRSETALNSASIVLYSAIQDYARANHYSQIPAGDIDRILSAAMSKVRGLGARHLAHLSPSASAVLDAVQSGFAQVYGGQAEAQREAMRRDHHNAAVNPSGSGHIPFTDARGMLVAARALAMQDGERSSGGQSGERPSSASYAYGHDAPLSATSASHFARELGMGPGYAGFFVGASPGMRDALRDAIKHGTPIGEDKVKDMRDVSAVVGAIRAGKLKPDDPRIPKSVQEIIKKMKEKGIDPATAEPKEIKKYLKEHPDDLNTVRKANDKTLGSIATKSDDELKRSNLDKKINVVPPTSKSDQKKPDPKIHSAKL